MRKPEAPDGEVSASGERKLPEENHGDVNERRQVIEEEISTLRKLVEWLRRKLH
jgi:hypothetical protein